MTTAAGGAPRDRRTFDEELGEAVHQVLWRRRIKQTEFAGRVLGITQSALSAKLHGRRPFYAGEVSLIAHALDLPVAQLMPPQDETEPPPDPISPGETVG
jgi:transcriptional regulator with XRE-family HTH domain